MGTRIPFAKVFLLAILISLGVNTSQAEPPEMPESKDLILFDELPTGDQILEVIGVKKRMKSRGFHEKELKTRGYTVKDDPPAQQGAESHSRGAKTDVSGKNISKQLASHATTDKLSGKSLSRAVAFPTSFELNASQLNQNLMAYADGLSNALTKAPNLKIHISGHTDSTGSKAYNEKLSLARSKSFYQYLVTKHNISSDRMTFSGEGDNKLLNKSNPEASENRRIQVDFVVDQVATANH